MAQLHFRIACFVPALFVLLCEVRSDKLIQVATGEDVVLPCTAPGVLTDNTGVLWTRVDLDPTYIIYYKNHRSDTYLQDPQYEGRVHMASPDLDKNDISLVIKTVSVKDSGVYLCKVIQGMTANGDFDGKTVVSIELSVSTVKKMEPKGEEPEEEVSKEEGPKGVGSNMEESEKWSLLLVVGLPLTASLLLLTAIGIGLFFKWKRGRRSSSSNTVTETTTAETGF